MRRVAAILALSMTAAGCSSSSTNTSNASGGSGGQSGGQGGAGGSSGGAGGASGGAGSSGAGGSPSGGSGGSSGTSDAAADAQVGVVDTDDFDQGPGCGTWKPLYAATTHQTAITHTSSGACSLCASDSTLDASMSKRVSISGPGTYQLDAWLLSSANDAGQTGWIAKLGFFQGGSFLSEEINSGTVSTKDWSLAQVVATTAGSPDELELKLVITAPAPCVFIDDIEVWKK